jgi:hypothetical protein
LDPIARVAASLRAFLNGIPAGTRSSPAMNLATNQCAKRRDRTNVFMCHVDHLLQLPWAQLQARAAHLSPAPQTNNLRMISIATPVKISRLTRPFA